MADTYSKCKSCVSGKCFWLIVFAISFFILSFCVHDEITASGNESSRLALVNTIVDQGTFAIDESIFGTVDYGVIDGHKYSDKPIIFSGWLALVYAFMKNIWLISFAAARQSAIYLINLIGVSSFTLMTMYLFFRRLLPEKGNTYQKALLAFSLVFCTWIFSYTVSINNHTVAAFLVFLLLVLTEKFRSGEHKVRTAFLCGLTGGFLCAVEIPCGGIFSLAALCGIIFAPHKSKLAHEIVSFFAGGFLPALLMALLGYYGWGSVLPVYLVPGAYDFAGNIHSTGIAGLHGPQNLFEYFFNITLGTRGLFSHMPFLLLIMPAVLCSKFRDKMGNREPLWFFLWASLATLFFYGFFTGDYGGWAYGFRFLIPVIPVLYLIICRWLLGDARRYVKYLAVVLLGIGFFCSAVGAYNPWPVCDEGAASNPKSLARQVKSPLKANLLCIQYEMSESGDFKPWFYREISDRYLYMAFTNMRRSVKPEDAQGNKFINPRRIPPAFSFVNNYILPLLSLGLFLLAVIYLAGRSAAKFLRRSTGSPDEVFMLYTIFASLIVILMVFLLGTAGALTGYCLLGLTIAPALYLWHFRKGGILRSRSLNLSFSLDNIFIAICLSVVLWRFTVMLPLTPNSWDAMTYHLYLPLRFVQEGRIFHIPTVFGDNAAAYSPLNGQMLYAALLAVFRYDFLLNCFPVIFLLFGALALSGIAREIGIESRFSRFAGVLFLLSPCFLKNTFTADVDIMALSFLLGGLFFLLRFTSKARNEEEYLCELLLSSLCLGLSVGTKVAYAPFGGGLAVVLVVYAICYLGRKVVKPLALMLLLMLVGGGFWYIRNWMLYGNPLFPVSIELGDFTIFPGAYDRAAVKAGEFHGSWSIMWSRLSYEYGYAFLTLVSIGFIGLWIWLGVCKKCFAKMSIVLLMSTLWAMIYCFVIPHNLEIRFLFPVISLSLIGVIAIVAVTAGILKDIIPFVMRTLIFIMSYLGIVYSCEVLRKYSVFQAVFIGILLFCGFAFYCFSRKTKAIRVLVLSAAMLLVIMTGMCLAPSLRSKTMRSSDFRF